MSQYILDHKRKLSFEDFKDIQVFELIKKSIKTEKFYIENRYVYRQGVGLLKTKYGKFWMYDFFQDDKWEKYSVIIKCAHMDNDFKPVFSNKETITVRLDSGCETGQVFDDITCDCSQQLHLMMKKISEIGEGIIISIPNQDGRGMGLPFKLAALTLQEYFHIDNVKASTLLNEGDENIDKRTYEGAINILEALGINKKVKVNLGTNNPLKIRAFKASGYEITEITPVIIKPTKQTRHHLQAKQDKLGHYLNLSTKENEK